jgi:hypothetical protein
MHVIYALSSLPPLRRGVQLGWRACCGLASACMACRGFPCHPDMEHAWVRRGSTEFVFPLNRSPGAPLEPAPPAFAVSFAASFQHPPSMSKRGRGGASGNKFRMSLALPVRDAHPRAALWSDARVGLRRHPILRTSISPRAYACPTQRTHATGLSGRRVTPFAPQGSAKFGIFLRRKGEALPPLREAFTPYAARRTSQ